MALFIRVTVVTHDGKLVTSYTMDYDNQLHRRNFADRIRAALSARQLVMTEVDSASARLAQAIFSEPKEPPCAS